MQLQREHEAEQQRGREESTASGDQVETLSYGRGAERHVVPAGVLRTPDGVVNLRPKAMQGPRKATGLQKSPVRSPPSSAVRHPDGG